MQQSKNFEELVDQRLGSKVNKEEAERMVKVALMCTNASPSLRPIMSEVVSMLEGQLTIPDAIPEANSYTDDLRFKAMRDFHLDKQIRGFTGSQPQNSTIIQPEMRSSFSSTQSFTGSQTLNSTAVQADKRSSSISSEDLFEIQSDTRPH